jgi:hypothetical protein
MKKSVIRLVGGIVGTIILVTPAFSQNKAFNGNWELDYAISVPSAKCEILRYSVMDDEQHYVVDEITNDGRPFNTEYRAKYDGKEYPNTNLITGNVNYVKLRKVADRVEQLTNIRREKDAAGNETSRVSGWYVRTLLPDGNTISSTLINADGSVYGVRFFRRMTDQKKTCVSK